MVIANLILLVSLLPAHGSQMFCCSKGEKKKLASDFVQLSACLIGDMMKQLLWKSCYMEDNLRVGVQGK